jgi:hypothetical protein
MNAIPVLGIPYYNRLDLLKRCILSIDHPVETLVLVDQGPMRTTGHIAFWEAARESVPACIHAMERIVHPNAGVAGAWNEIIKLFPAKWWMIANNDIAFAPGDLEKMARFVEENQQLAQMVYGNHGASWFSITARGINTAGLFDENIYPAYLEDCDMSRRFDLLGLRRCDVPDVHAQHGDGFLTGSCTVNSSPELRKKNGVTHGRNFEYYRAKWGGINGEEKYEFPFNNPKIPVWSWRYDPWLRALQKGEF